MANHFKNSTLAVVLSSYVTSAYSLPMLDEPIPLPGDFDGIVTIYPDNHSTATVQNFWIIPSTARIVKNPDGKLAFGLVHSGVSAFDPDGISALVSSTFQPYVDSATLQKAKDLITTEVEAKGGKAYFRFISPKETQAWLLIGGQLINWDRNDPDAKIMGGAVEAGIPYQIKIRKAIDVRSLAQAGGGDANTLGVMFKMKFEGLRSRCHFSVTAKFKETFEHFKARVSSSGWFGITRASASTDIQSLTSSDALKIDLDQCTQETFDKYYPEKAVEGLMANLAARTGAFARVLKPSGIPDAPGGGGIFGWGLSAGGGFERYEEKRDLTFEYDLNFIKDQEIVFGMTFPSDGPQLSPYVKNLTDTGKPFPTSADYLAITKQHKACRTANLTALKKAKDDGYLTDDLFNKYVGLTYEKGCYVDYSIEALKKIYGVGDMKELKNNPKENVIPALIFELNSPE